MPEGVGWAWWIGTLIGLFIGLVIKDAASAFGKRLLHRVTPGFTELEAKAQKTGELSAIQKDLHNLVAQTAQITSVQSKIQAEINGDLWARQMVWQQKRDIYFSILKLAHAFQKAMGTMSSALTVYQQNLHSNASRENLDVAWSQVKTSLTQYNEAQQPYLDALIEAQVFVSPIVIDHLKEAQSNRSFFVFEGFSQPAAPGYGQKGIERALQFLIPWTVKMVALARQDLGVSDT